MCNLISHLPSTAALCNTKSSALMVDIQTAIIIWQNIAPVPPSGPIFENSR